jgi:hypothetical protein
MSAAAWVSQQSSPPEHAGRHPGLAQRRSTDPAALGPRSRDLDECLLELGETGGLVELCELGVDVEPLLTQLDLTDTRRSVGNPLFDLGTPLLEVGPAACRHLRCPQAVR